METISFLISFFSLSMFFSPQPSPQIATFATAEIAIYCTEPSVLLLIAKLKSFISETDLFESDYLNIRYPSKYVSLPYNIA